MTALVVAGLVALAVLLCFPAVGGPGRSVRLTSALAVPLAGLVVVADGLPAQRVVLLLVLLASLADLARRLRRRRRRAAADAGARRLLEICEAMAADLHAGLPPLHALESAAEDWPVFAPVLQAARWGAEVPQALRELAELPGAGQARVVAAAWQVAHRSGAGLAPALTLAAQALREERSTAAFVATELAGARATAALLAALPLGLLALGSGVGGDPVRFLTGTGPGLGCLAIGVGLIHLGLAWIDAIADGVDG